MASSGLVGRDGVMRGIGSVGRHALLFGHIDLDDLAFVHCQRDIAELQRNQGLADISQTFAQAMVGIRRWIIRFKRHESSPCWRIKIKLNQIERHI